MDKIMQDLHQSIKDLQASIKELQRGIKELQADIIELPNLFTGKIGSPEKMVIERLQTNQLDFNLESIAVQNLTGMLSVGLNYGSDTSGIKIKPPITQAVKQATVKNEAPLREKPRVNLKYKPI